MDQYVCSLKELKLKASKLGLQNVYWNVRYQKSLKCDVTLQYSLLSLSIFAHYKCLKVTDLKDGFLLLILLTGMLEAEASGCADTGEMKYLGVNCVQGTAGLLPLNSDTHLHVPKYSQPYSTKILKGGGRWPEVHASDEREERRCDSQTSAVSTTPQTGNTGVIISHSSVGLKANRDPRRDHLRSWRTWPECTSYVVAGCAGLACLWSRQHSWHSAGPEGQQTQPITNKNPDLTCSNVHRPSTGWLLNSAHPHTRILHTCLTTIP